MRSVAEEGKPSRRILPTVAIKTFSPRPEHNARQADLEEQIPNTVGPGTRLRHTASQWLRMPPPPPSRDRRAKLAGSIDPGHNARSRHRRDHYDALIQAQR
jgi:hypothetical protein